ncbi:MAG TPA: hypothetical protein VE291_00020 [Terracidiphilus sp.]|nr:hypothetical protein [Terracidiphilus sp.]
METALRPLTLGEILDRTAQLYRSNFLLFAGIASVYAGALLALSLLQIAVQEWLRTHHMATELIWAGIAGAIITFPIIIICSGFAIAANNRAVAWLYLGQPATIRGAYRSILPRLGRYLWLMTVTTFRVWAPCALVYAGLLCFMVFYAKPKGILAPAGHVSDSQLYIVFVAVVGVFCILLLGAFIYAALMGLRYSLAVPACVIEDIKARAAIRRSVQLSKGARGRIFLLGLLVVAVDSGLVLITQAFFLFAAVKYHGQLPAGMRALQQVVAFFTNTFVGPIYATGFTLFYYDQRVRKEGFDIEWMMRAAGLSAPEPPALPEPSAQNETHAPPAISEPEQAHE